MIFSYHEQQQILKLIKLPKSNQEYKEQKGLIQ